MDVYISNSALSLMLFLSVRSPLQIKEHEITIVNLEFSHKSETDILRETIVELESEIANMKETMSQNQNKYQDWVDMKMMTMDQEIDTYRILLEDHEKRRQDIISNEPKCTSSFTLSSL